MSDAQHMTDITPDTTVGALLAAFPQIEDALIDLAPPLAALRNRVLRETIGTVATLRQVAEMSGKPLGFMINELRTKAGLGTYNDHAFGDGDRGIAAPKWFDQERIAVSYDARMDLASGFHPAQKVMQELDTLPDGGIYELITPFKPGPLIEMAQQRGYASWSRETGPSEIRNYFVR